MNFSETVVGFWIYLAVIGRSGRFNLCFSRCRPYKFFITMDQFATAGRARRFELQDRHRSLRRKHRTRRRRTNRGASGHAIFAVECFMTFHSMFFQDTNIQSQDVTGIPSIKLAEHAGNSWDLPCDLLVSTLQI